MAQPQEARRVWVVRLEAWTRDHLTSFADLRDLVLVVAGGLYLLGYMVWAFNHAQRPAFRSATFEIKKDAVQAVVWCD